MNLFINSVSTNGMLIIFNNKREVIAKKPIKVLMKESSSLLVYVDEFLNQNDLGYGDLDNIVVVHGPGSFTGIRTVSLIVNSISFAIDHLYLTPVSFFDLLDSYPCIKSSSKRDLFVKKSKAAKIEIVNNDDFLLYIKDNRINTVYGDSVVDFLGDIPLEFEVDYANIIQNVVLNKQKEIQPLYMKKPNIT